MKVLVALFAFVALAAAVPIITKEELAILEAFDYDGLFANDENRKIVFDCLLDKGDCGPYKQIAELSKKAIADQCGQCSPNQKKIYDHVIKVLKDNYPSFFSELLQKAASKKEQ